MGQDFKPVNVKNCYACLQWDGNRTYYPDRKVVKVDDRTEANCRIYHKKIKGTSFCEHYHPMV